MENYGLFITSVSPQFFPESILLSLPQETFETINSIEERIAEGKNKQNKFQLLLGNYVQLIYRVVLPFPLFAIVFTEYWRTKAWINLKTSRVSWERRERANWAVQQNSFHLTVSCISNDYFIHATFRACSRTKRSTKRSLWILEIIVSRRTV